MTSRQVRADPNTCAIGLPQGSVLISLLCALYIRDMLTKIEGLLLQRDGDCTFVLRNKSKGGLQQMMKMNGDAPKGLICKWGKKTSCLKADMFLLNVDM